MILGDPWETGKDIAVLGTLDVALQGDHALGLHGLGQQEQQRKQIAVVRRFPLGAGEHLAEDSGGGLDRGHAVGDEEGGDPRPADGHQLVRRRFEDHRQLAAGDDVAAEHGAEQHHNADDLKHASPPD